MYSDLPIELNWRNKLSDMLLGGWLVGCWMQQLQTVQQGNLTFCIRRNCMQWRGNTVPAVGMISFTIEGGECGHRADWMIAGKGNAKVVYLAPLIQCW